MGGRSPVPMNGRPAVPSEGTPGLRELARNLWWSWDPEAVVLWDELAASLGVAGEEWAPRNPVRLLERADPPALRRIARDPAFRKRLKSVLSRLHRHCGPRRPREAALRLPGPVAYFSMEVGVH